MTPEKLTDLKKRIGMADKEAAEQLVREAQRSNNSELWDWAIKECENVGTRMMLEAGSWGMLGAELSKRKEHWDFENTDQQFTVVRQDWLESESGWGKRPDGCSLHLTYEDHKKYCEIFWDGQRARNNERYGEGVMPNEYTRENGRAYPVTVSEEIFEKIRTSDGGWRTWKNLKTERVK